MRTGGADVPAIKVSVENAPGNASTNVQVSSTIARGFQTGYNRQAPTSATVGDANLRSGRRGRLAGDAAGNRSQAAKVGFVKRR